MRVFVVAPVDVRGGEEEFEIVHGWIGGGCGCGFEAFGFFSFDFFHSLLDGMDCMCVCVCVCLYVCL